MIDVHRALEVHFNNYCSRHINQTLKRNYREKKRLGCLRGSLKIWLDKGKGLYFS